jgi:hypothetical protein
MAYSLEPGDPDAVDLEQATVKRDANASRHVPKTRTDPLVLWIGFCSRPEVIEFMAFSFAYGERVGCT